MRKLIIPLSLIMSVCALLSSCDRIQTTKLDSFVQMYYSFDSFYLVAIDEKCVDVANSIDWNSILTYYCCNTNKYNDLCQKHGDTSYNFKWESIEGSPNVINYPSFDFENLSIVSDKDYDVRHPAGTSLNDVVRYMSFSPKKFIESGYKKKYKYDGTGVSATFVKYMDKGLNWECPDDRNDYSGAFYPVDKQADEITAEDMELNSNFFFINISYSSLVRLAFESEPTIKGPRKITVTLKGDNGETYSASTEMSF